MTLFAKPHNKVRENLDRPQVKASQYGHAYMNKMRLASFWHQVEEVSSFSPSSVVEVGPGPGFVSETLRYEGIKVFTIDVDPELRPLIVASLRALPLRDKCVDVALCCQVLEHLPFEKFAGAIAELARVARRGFVISLPDRDRCFGYSLYKLTERVLNGVIELPRSKGKRPKDIDLQHFWEIGAGEIDLKTVTRIIHETIRVEPRTYRVPEFLWHRFFVVNLIEAE